MVERTEQSDAEQGEIRVGGTTIRYAVVRSHRRRRTMEIVVDARDGVRVSVPQFTPRHEVASFVEQRAPWIARHAAVARGFAPRAWVSGETLPYVGGPLTLRVALADTRAAFVTHDRERAILRVDLPDALVPDARGAAVRDAVLRWYRARAERVLVARTARWSEHLRLFPRRVIVKEQRRRWGSCSREGTIRLNWRIVMAPPPLVDYVIVHELMHLLVRNHSASFWAHVGQALPDSEARRARLQELAAAFDL